ncbi:DNA gyrase subunit A [Thermostichus vulcanus]|uniref:DNA gyrase subunit A n=1 Tax=Thermostichus vulcanus str. 'Rupite' TaxID=2813851 RepID=A0ABT0CEN7_THEVL|nr:DNA gyrase subunit A [Thermostichus vulcanus]MCJ2544241.1 DNA gyrase subunit A [Thermostichus vulcanus str. 'Rupite']
MSDNESTARIISTDLQQEMSQSYLEYAMSVIVGRALPDARDGLKPVHRRILYAMHELGLSADRPFRKCARVVGDVIGKYHPHGDQAVYDALVRMAQDFSMREPLVDGHGNFGSIDNDPPAAMRYTECRLTAFAQTSLLQDIDANTVDFGDNYDGSQQEPLVLPTRIPQLLLNGSSGIAVGMATNIPPHNLGELVDGLIALIQNPNLTSLELMQWIPAPDFPTGALIMGQSGIREAYTTGRGSITMRGVATIETLEQRGRPTRDAIIITELPYQTNKAAMIEKIAEMVNEKRLEGIADIRDESDRDGMRVVIELKRDAQAQVVLNNLYKQTPLQANFGVNMLAILQGEPRTLTLRDSLQAFLDFRQEVIERRTRYELQKAEERDHLLQGYLLALAHLDRVIVLIREAADTATARAELQAVFGLSEAQADGILQMQLRRLTALESEKIQAEHEELVRRIADLRDILARRERVMQIISEELEQIKARFASPRRSQICLDDSELDTADLIENRETIIFLTEQGYIKRMGIEEFQVQGRATRGKAGARIKEDDAIEQFFACRSHDTILLFTDRGVVYTLRGYQVPQGSRTARGSAIVQLLPITREERITSMVPVSEFTDDEYLVMLTRGGYIKKTALSAFANVRSNGLIAISLEENDELRWVRRARSSDDVVMATRQGMSIRFRADDEQLRPLGRATRGVRAITLNPGDNLVSMDIISAESVMAAEQEGEGLANPWVLVITKAGRGKRSAIDNFRQQNRGGKGVIATKFRQDSDELAALRIVNAEDEIMLVTARGIVMRQAAKAIPTQSREATGVLVQRLDPEDSIVGVTVVPASFIGDPEEADEIVDGVSEED